MIKELTEFTYKDKSYQVQTISGIDQCILAGQISPLILPVIAVAVRDGIPEQLANVDAESPEGRGAIIGAFLSNMETLAGALKTMPKEEMRIIYNECMRHLKRHEGGRWFDIFNEASGRLMYDDIEGFDVMMLSIEVVKDQLGNFIRGALSRFGLRAQL